MHKPRGWMWNTRECANSSVSTACLEVLNRRTDNIMTRRERTNNDLQKNIQKTKALERRNAEISGDGRRCPGSISCYCTTSGTDRVTLVNCWYVMNEERTELITTKKIITFVVVLYHKEYIVYRLAFLVMKTFE